MEEFNSYKKAEIDDFIHRTTETDIQRVVGILFERIKELEAAINSSENELVLLRSDITSQNVETYEIRKLSSYIDITKITDSLKKLTSDG